MNISPNSSNTIRNPQAVLTTFDEVVDVIVKEMHGTVSPLLHLDQWGSLLHELEDAIFDRASEFRNARAYQLVSHSRRWRDPAVAQHITLYTAFCGPGTRNWPNFFDSHLDEAMRKFETNGWKPTVAVTVISPPDRYGQVTLGPSAGLSDCAVRNAKTRIGIINRSTPKFRIRPVGSWNGVELMSGCCFDIRDFKYVIYVDLPADEAAPQSLDADQMKIARAVAGIIPNGVALQVGIGQSDNLFIPELYSDHSDLGIFAELMSRNVWNLYRRGNARAENWKRAPGTAWTSFVAPGPQSFHDSLDREAEGDKLVVLPASTMVDTRFIVEMNRGRPLYSVNGALAVDGKLAIASAGIGTEVHSAVGGSLRYVEAAHATGGQSIIVMRSTFRNPRTGNMESRVMPVFPEGTEPTISVRLSQVVVTENGIAFGIEHMTPFERLTCAAGLCAPEFRDRFISEANRHFGYQIDRQMAEEKVRFPV